LVVAVIDTFVEVDESAPRLIVIRGNSASGKTTLAGGLQRALGRGTANIGQDHFRRVVLGEHDVPDGDNIELINRTARHCLGIGYHVILEGILVADHYGAMLRGLIEDHPGRSHVFYLEAPLEMTVERHEGRTLRADIDPSKLREWYVPSDVLDVPGELVIDGTATFQNTLRRIRDAIGPVEPRMRDMREQARFI
jgi:predicted kinase